MPRASCSCAKPSSQPAKTSPARPFEQLFHERGLPLATRSDNGVPFASPNALFNLSKLSVWWLRLGIAIERIKPGHPQQNGRHERLRPSAPDSIRLSCRLHPPVTCVIRGEHLCELFHVQTLGMRENSDGQDIVRSQHRRFDRCLHVAGFAVADSQARAPLVLAKAQPSAFKMMTSANQLPSEQFADYSFVFN